MVGCRGYCGLKLQRFAGTVNFYIFRFDCRYGIAVVYDKRRRIIAVLTEIVRSRTALVPQNQRQRSALFGKYGRIDVNFHPARGALADKKTAEDAARLCGCVCPIDRCLVPCLTRSEIYFRCTVYI